MHIARGANGVSHKGLVVAVLQTRSHWSRAIVGRAAISGFPLLDTEKSSASYVYSASASLETLHSQVPLYTYGGGDGVAFARVDAERMGGALSAPEKLRVDKNLTAAFVSSVHGVVVQIIA